jgi:hypothetical protein
MHSFTNHYVRSWRDTCRIGGVGCVTALVYFLAFRSFIAVIALNRHLFNRVSTGFCSCFSDRLYVTTEFLVLVYDPGWKSHLVDWNNSVCHLGYLNGHWSGLKCNFIRAYTIGWHCPAFPHGENLLIYSLFATVKSVNVFTVLFCCWDYIALSLFVEWLHSCLTYIIISEFLFIYPGIFQILHSWVQSHFRKCLYSVDSFYIVLFCDDCCLCWKTL